MFGVCNRKTVHEVLPADLHDMVVNGAAIVVDVREPLEFAAGHIPGAVNLPLSQFEVSNLPIANGKTIVLNCAGGARSAKALQMCGDVPVEIHLAGGMGAWTRAGLPIER